MSPSAAHDSHGVGHGLEHGLEHGVEHGLEHGPAHDAVRVAVLRMGHDIVRHFAHRSHDQAVEEVSAHILKFWEPRMLAELRRCVREDSHDVEPILAEAVRTWPDEEETQADRDIPSGG